MLILYYSTLINAALTSSRYSRFGYANATEKSDERKQAQIQKPAIKLALQAAVRGIDVRTAIGEIKKGFHT